VEKGLAIKKGLEGKWGSAALAYGSGTASAVNAAAHLGGAAPVINPTVAGALAGTAGGQAIGNTLDRLVLNKLGLGDGPKAEPFALGAGGVLGANDPKAAASLAAGGAAAQVIDKTGSAIANRLDKAGWPNLADGVQGATDVFAGGAAGAGVGGAVTKGNPLGIGIGAVVGAGTTLAAGIYDGIFGKKEQPEGAGTDESKPVDKEEAAPADLPGGVPEEAQSGEANQSTPEDAVSSEANQDAEPGEASQSTPEQASEPNQSVAE